METPTEDVVRENGGKTIVDQVDEASNAPFRGQIISFEGDEDLKIAQDFGNLLLRYTNDDVSKKHELKPVLDESIKGFLREIAKAIIYKKHPEIKGWDFSINFDDKNILLTNKKQ